MAPDLKLRRRALRLGAVAALLGGVALIGSALLGPAKAALGWWMLDRAFEARRAAPEATQSDAKRWRPWSWADLAPIGRLNFPRLGESRVVLDSASGEAMAWGLGRVRAAAELGAPGLTAVAGHRDGSFTLLGDVEIGDVVELTTLRGAPIRYRIVRREVADSRTTGLPLRHHGPDELVLVTCWPIDALISGPERLLVYAQRLPSEDLAAAR